MAMMPKSGVSEAAADGGPEMQLVAVAKAGRIRALVLCNQTDERTMSYKGKRAVDSKVTTYPDSGVCRFPKAQTESCCSPTSIARSPTNVAAAGRKMV